MEQTMNFRVLRKCSNKFDCLIFEMFFIWDLKPKLNRVILSVQSCLHNTFNSFHFFTSYLHFIYTFCYFLLSVCKYLAFTFIPLFQKLYIMWNFYFMTFNLIKVAMSYSTWKMDRRLNDFLLLQRKADFRPEI